jgi:hypothetical protein
MTRVHWCNGQVPTAMTDMKLGRMISRLLLASLVIGLAGCLGQGDGTVRSEGLLAPVRLQALPVAGTMRVNVYMNDETEPRLTRTVEPGSTTIQLEFTAPEGEHTFTVLFDYLDPEFAHPDGGSWTLASWTSGPVRVVSGEAAPLNITSYVYEDFDLDGISNLEELIARTDPADESDPVPSGGSTLSRVRNPRSPRTL